MNKRIRQKHALLRFRKDGSSYPSRLLIRRAKRHDSSYETEHARVFMQIASMNQKELSVWIDTELLGETTDQD